MVPVYKGKRDKGEFSNFKGISLLSVLGKLYGRVVIESEEMHRAADWEGTVWFQ